MTKIMPQYIRALFPAGTSFFTVTLLERRRKIMMLKAGCASLSRPTSSTSMVPLAILNNYPAKYEIKDVKQNRDYKSVYVKIQYKSAKNSPRVENKGNIKEIIILCYIDDQGLLVSQTFSFYLEVHSINYF